MTGARLYLDWNATAPLRPEARAAMAAAMDVVGNPSSVHAEGRAAKALIERARAQVAAALGGGRGGYRLHLGRDRGGGAGLCRARAGLCRRWSMTRWRPGAMRRCRWTRTGRVAVADPARTALQLANSETGVVQDLPAGLAVSDLTQAFGKLPFAFNWLGCDMGLVSAHKLGGPKGVGRAGAAAGLDVPPQLKGGGQEMGRRAGHREPDRHRRFCRRGRGGGARSGRMGSGTRWPKLEIF